MTMNAGNLHRPGYNPEMITPGIAHFGVGNFHRSHQAMYMDRLISLGRHDDWGIVGIGVMPGDAVMRDALAGQDYGYTLVEKSGDGSVEAREIRSIRELLFAPDDPDAVIRVLTDPAIRIVSLTITEGGYNIDRATGEFDLTNPLVQRDLVQPDRPGTVFGYITEALRIRRENDIAPFTVMSCDNLPGNGDVTRQAILTYASALNSELAQWVGGNVGFPNSMVDRITPVTTDADRALVSELYGIDDAWPVVAEPFTQWVLEDHFSSGRPAFERVGVQMVNDVVPYELMKLRLLNASHQAMAYIGMLLSHTYVHEAVADKDVDRFLRAYLAEARVTLPLVPGIDVDAYIESLFTRFHNPYIADTLARLAVDASDRIPKFVVPAVRDNLSAGRSIPMGAAVVASWARYLQVATTVEIVDSMAKELSPRANDPYAFIEYGPVFGDLGQNPRFVDVFVEQLALLQKISPRDWLGSLVAR